MQYGEPNARASNLAASRVAPAMTDWQGAGNRLAAQHPAVDATRPHPTADLLIPCDAS